MKNIILGADQVSEFIFTRDRNETLNEVVLNCGNTFEMEMWSSQLYLQFKQSQIWARKTFQGVNGIRSHGFYVCAAVLYQLSYEDPDVGADQFIEFIFTRDRKWEVKCS